jgi:putative transposase
LVSFPRSQFYYSSKRDEKELMEAIQELAFKYPSYGFRKLFAYLRRSGKTWNHKKVYRVYKLLKLNKKRRGKRRLHARVKQQLIQQERINNSWSMDFMSDSLMGISKFRTLNVLLLTEANPKQSEQTTDQSSLPRVLNYGVKIRG